VKSRSVPSSTRSRVRVEPLVVGLFSVVDGTGRSRPSTGRSPSLAARVEVARLSATGSTSLIRLRLLTGQRGGEVHGARWDEVDLTSGWWTIPADRSKNGLSHPVPLSPRALDIFRRLHEYRIAHGRPGDNGERSGRLGSFRALARPGRTSQGPRFRDTSFASCPGLHRVLCIVKLRLGPMRTGGAKRMNAGLVCAQQAQGRLRGEAP
jgi:integrase